VPLLLIVHIVTFHYHFSSYTGRVRKLSLYLIAALCFVAFVLFLRVSAANISWIASGSMLPGFAVHDRLLVNQLAWGLNLPFLNHQVHQWRTPERGDVVLFHNPYDAQRIWMKRVVGLPGDVIAFHDQQLWINDQACVVDAKRYEFLPRRDGQPAQGHRIWFSWWEHDWGPTTVAPGQLFLMGDNRGASDDSRDWGTLAQTQLTGQPWFKLWPLKSFAVRIP